MEDERPNIFGMDRENLIQLYINITQFFQKDMEDRTEILQFIEAIEQDMNIRREQEGNVSQDKG